MLEKQPNQQAIFASDITRRFLLRVIQEGAHLQPPAYPNQTWIRNRNITGTFFLSGSSLEDVGKIYGGITRERVRQIIRQTFNSFHQNLTPESQIEFPLDQIQTRKPVTIDHAKKQSIILGGKSAHLAEALDQGKTYDEAAAEQNITGKRKSQLKRTLHIWGYDLPSPESSTADYHALHKQLSDRMTPQDKINDLVKKVDRGYYHFDLNQDEQTLTAISHIAREAGLRFRLLRSIPRITEVLEREGLPVIQVVKEIKTGRLAGRNLRYNLTATRLKTQAVEVLKQSADLQDLTTSPVTLVCGPSDSEYPPTTAFAYKSESYTSLRPILIELGLNRFAAAGNYDELFDSNFPVPVFFYKSHYVLHAHHSEAFKKYVQEKFSS